MKIGVFPGSFNPIHTGHLILANYIVEFTEIDEIWFIVSPQNPFKQDKQQADGEIRFQMVKLAIESYPKMKACDIELSMPQPSYTIDTLKKLSEEYPQHQFFLIIGADNWDEIERWKSYQDILDNYSIKVYPRLGYRLAIPPKVRNKVEAIESPIIEISSTFIRDSIFEEKDIKAFLPDKVSDYIKQHKLYK